MEFDPRVLHFPSFYSVFLYFFVLIFTGLYILINVPLRQSKSLRGLSLALLFLGSLPFLLSSTWKYIFEYMRDDFADYQNDIFRWLDESKLFLDAYLNVSQTPLHWFWSSQLLLWVPTAFLFLKMESARVNANHDKKSDTLIARTLTPGKTWVFSVFAELCAVSVSFAIWLATYFSSTYPASSHHDIRTRIRNPPIINSLDFFFLLTAITSVAFLPSSGEETFHFLLMALHSAVILISIPFTSSTSKQSTNTKDEDLKKEFLFYKRSIRRICKTYMMVALFVMMIHFYHAYKAFEFIEDRKPGLSFDLQLKTLFDAGWKNPCQSSITNDMIFTSGLLSIFMLIEGGLHGLLWIIFTPFLSIGASFPLFLMVREMNMMKKIEKEILNADKKSK